ncbi:hypothetical protein EDD76_12138 [Kineothrix alysoides]|uniref:Uncharacterized protein n=1 Tax=Kineothrix alysoides TaxID=1469948 RepID=A0A4R1QKR7_9FIRM|nr:hypothetical protein [Kineothrix alysoides]TCL54268.1 hypothetical protein EDD76_12138 [Kineothrix alysoides]
MDKYEYKVRAEEIKALIAEGEFAEAVKIADTIDWRRVKSVMMLCTISDLYKINRRFQESKDILLMAYERHPGGRLIVYSLCELSVKMGEYVQAIEYYKEFVQIAPKDTGRYILQYKLYEAQDVSLEERIAVLEEFKKRDYREKWAYELAYLYHRVGLETKCVEECDEMILWFGEGRHVIKALELKQLHHALTPDQQEKYLLLKRERELQEAQAAASEELQEQEQAESAKIADFSEYTAQNDEDDEEEEEFRVKTVDVGQYNTINLQKELAKSMKELLGEDVRSDTEEPSRTSSVNFASFQAEPAPAVQPVSNVQPMPAIPDTATKIPTFEEQGIPGISPVLSEQNTMAAHAVAENLQPQFTQPQPTEEQTALEEVFFEDIKDVLLEDTKEINVKEVNAGNLSDTKEIHPGRRVIYPATVSPSSTVSAPASMPTIPSHQLKATIKPSGFERMLSQEYDGQISLAVSEGGQLEKQITGQMNITDIMTEWEKMKKENKEKRSADVRRRVEQHTGNMFSEFDEATKKGLLEQLEKAVVEAILKEAGKKAVSPEEIPDARLSDIVVAAEKSAMQPASAGEEAGSESNEVQDPAASVQEEIPAASPAEDILTPQTLEESGTQEQETVSLEDRKDAEQIIDLETVSFEMEPVNTAEKVVGMVEDANRLRPLSNEEKELFGRFIYNKKAKEQIIQAVDTMSMDAFTDNVIITGEEGTGTIELAKNLIRMMQMSDSNFSGKVAKISGATLKKKNVEETLSHLTDGALIIERATEMSSATAADLKKALSQENNGLLVIMEGKKDEMNIFLRKNHILSENFNARIDIEALNDHALVEYAKQYAQEMEYSIDNLGILALHTRIADMQTSDHEVTVAEVKELVDDAIYFADKKNLRHLCDILVGKRYDEEDMIVLREKDFMHY